MQTIVLDVFGYASDHLKGNVAVTCEGQRILMGGRDRKKGSECYLLGKKKTDYRKLVEKRKAEFMS